MSEIADKLRAVVKLRAQLERDVSKLDAKIAGCHRSLKRLQGEREAAMERLASIEDALRPLTELGDGVVTTRRAIAAANGTASPGGRRRIDDVVHAIGSFGLDPWTPRQVAETAGIPLTSLSPYLTQLVAAGRIRRTARGEYRTMIAKVAS